MAKPKGEPTNVRSFKLPVELDAALKDFAASCGKSVTDILVDVVAKLIDDNKAHIANFRRNIGKAKTIPTFTAPQSEPKKTARSSKKKSAAPPIESPTPPVGELFAPNTAAAISRPKKGQTITVNVTEVKSPPTKVQITMHGGDDGDEVKGSGDNENS